MVLKNMKNILIVEDDKTLCDGIAIAIKESDTNIIQSGSVADARRNIKCADLVILDINLPDGSGLDFLKEIRRWSVLPVIMLTANDMETDIVMGLESGADDYITKPFSLAVLRARVHTQLRREDVIKDKNFYKSANIIEIDNFYFDFDGMEYRREGENIELSKTEQKLLKLLVFNRGHIVLREELIDKIWSSDAEYVDTNALSVTIKRLRDKLEKDSAKPEYIKTVYGIGYTWENAASRWGKDE